MISLTITFCGPDGATDEDLDQMTSRVVDALYAIDRGDIDFTASLSERSVIFTVFDDADLSVDALLSDIRTALHAAGCATAGWEEASAHLSGDLTRKLVSA